MSKCHIVGNLLSRLNCLNFITSVIKPVSNKRYKSACGPIEDADQHVQSAKSEW